MSDETRSQRRKRFRFWTITLAVVLLLAGSGYLLSQRSSQTTSQGGSANTAGGKGGRRGAGGPTPVSAAKVTRGNMGVYINALGTVTPVYTVTVTSRVAGELMEVNYREGQIVQKGQLLATIDPRPYQAIVTQAQGQLQRDQAGLKNALIDLDRYRSVYSQHAIPEQQVATQTALVDQDQGTVKLDQGNLDAAQVNLNYAVIRSPITGRVGLRTVDPGNIVPANGATGIATITQLQPITVIFTIPEDYIDQVAPQMRAGHKLQVNALDRSDEHQIAQGTLLTLDNQIDVTTATVRARAAFANKQNELFPNEFVNVSVLVKTLMGVNLIPTAAIQRNNDVAFLYVIDPANSTVHSRNIQIAAINGDTAAVTGVVPGESLVTDGFDRLVDNAKVSVRQRGVPGGDVNANEPSPDSMKANEANPATSGNAQSNSTNTAKPHSRKQNQGSNQ
jgi:membrane fusion protein, multidrug efflux system